MRPGDCGEPIVIDGGGHETFLRTLREMCGRMGIEIHAYVLSDKHFHLVLETSEGKRKANDEEKVSVAEMIASETSMRLDWLPEERGMGSHCHCSQLINDQRRRLGTDKVIQKKRA